jgi:hypothetical protein
MIEDIDTTEVNIPESTPIEEELETVAETESEPSADENTEQVEETTEETVEEESTTANEQEEPVFDVKEIPGETPKERALRQVVKKLRGKLREENRKLVSEEPLFVKESGELPDELKDYDAEELAKLEKFLSARGYIKKDEVEQKAYNSVRDEIWAGFLDEHPEYLPENDTDDVLWKAFQEELGLYARPKNPKDFKKLFDRVHKNIFDENPKISPGQVAAKAEKIKVASSGSATIAKPKNNATIQKSNDSELAKWLKGFSEDEIADILG